MEALLLIHLLLLPLFSTISLKLECGIGATYIQADVASLEEEDIDNKITKIGEFIHPHLSVRHSWERPTSIETEPPGRIGAAFRMKEDEVQQLTS